MIASLKHVSVKATQGNLQKKITWTKHLNKGKEEWEMACVERGLRFWKLKTLVKTRFASKVIMFEEVLEFKKTFFVI